jgi:hypothetical protein
MQKIELCIFKSINEEKEIRKWIKKYIWEIVNKHNNQKNNYINKDNEEVINNIIDYFYFLWMILLLLW